MKQRTNFYSLKQYTTRFILFKKILGYHLINIRQTLWTNAHKKKKELLAKSLCHNSLETSPSDSSEEIFKS